jgi:hypothetical protein
MAAWTVVVFLVQASPALAPVMAYADPKPLVAPYIMTMWNKVAWCETHGQWHRDQPTFDGGLGISRVNWNAYGGQDFASAPHFATPEEQVIVARRIQASAGVPNYIPDQNGGCHAW